MKGRKFIPWLVVGLGLLVYANSLRVGFMFDDAPHIVENPWIRHLWPPWDLLRHTSRPVVMITLALNYALGGLNPWGYHLFNVGIHILAALTLYGVVRLTLVSEGLRSRWGETASWLAGLISLLWLVHPLQTESVTYVIQRGESLMGLFYLLTLYCVIRSCGSSSSMGWQMGAVASCALGMASKPVMVTAPVVVLLYDRAFLAKSWREVMKRRGALYACLAVTWLLLPLLLAIGPTDWRDSAGFGYGGLPALQFTLTQPGAILHYLRLALWPHPLCFDYGWNYGWPSAQTLEEALPELMVVGALLAATAWAWWRKPALGFLGAWFFLILAPSSSFVPVADLVVEHRLYLPLAAVMVMAIVGVFELARDLLSVRQQKMLPWAVSGVLVMALAMLTIQRNHDYRSELAIWQDTVDKCPNNPRAHYNVGVALSHAGRLKDSIGYYKQALQIRPKYVDALYNLGGVLARLGEIEEAQRYWEQALQLKPDFAEVHYNLGVALVNLNKVPEAMEHWEEALRIRPDYAEAHYNLGNALLTEGKFVDAMGHWEQALRIKPDYAEAHYNLAGVLAGLGRVQEAIQHWEQALQIKPDYAEAHYDLGIALEQEGRIPAAIAHFEQALKIKPDYAEAQNRLARLQAVQ